MHKDAVLYSFDPQTKHTNQGGKFDEELIDLLTRYRLIDRVNVVQEDSQLAPVPEGEFGLVLVDGDPSLEGTRADFARFCTRIRPGGHALFHDAAADGPRRGTLEPLIAEIDRDERFARQPDIGTFVHFRRV
jgi:hypothetical protein